MGHYSSGPSPGRWPRKRPLPPPGGEKMEEILNSYPECTFAYLLIASTTKLELFEKHCHSCSLVMCRLMYIRPEESKRTKHI